MKYIYSLNNAIDELIGKKNAYVIGEDIMDPYGGAFKVTRGLSKKYPDNIIGVPMSEQGFTAVAVGMALMGDYVVEEVMFGDFVTLTADQLINHAAKFHDLYGQKLHFVIRTPSGAYRGYGATHSQSLEKMFLGIPGLNIIVANIFINVGGLLIQTIEEGTPALFIENKLDYPKELLLQNFDIFERTELNGNVRISIENESPELTIITYGGISGMAVDTAKKLMYDEEVAIDVIVVSHISDSIKQSSVIELLRTEFVLIVEESTGGYGFSAQAAFELITLKKKVEIITSKCCFIPSAEIAEHDVLVSSEQIYDTVMNILHK